MSEPHAPDPPKMQVKQCAKGYMWGADVSMSKTSRSLHDTCEALRFNRMWPKTYRYPCQQQNLAKNVNISVTIEKNILIYGVIISTGYTAPARVTMNLLIGALLLNPRNPLDQGSTVHALSSLATIILGDCTIASILDPVGNLILIQVESICSILGPQNLIAIDSSIPIGCGQRELIVGDRQTGKTSISIDSILNQKYSTIFTVYTSLGQSSSSILQVFLSLVQKDAIFYLSMLMATASSSAVHQYLCAYT